MTMTVTMESVNISQTKNIRVKGKSEGSFGLAIVWGKRPFSNKNAKSSLFGLVILRNCVLKKVRKWCFKIGASSSFFEKT